MPQPKLLIATSNIGKMREYQQLLLDVPVEFVQLENQGIFEVVEELEERGTV